MKAAFSSALLLLTALGSAQAQQMGSIQGTVAAAATHKAIEGARVSVQGTKLGTTTDAKGHYEILNLSPGAYTLRGQDHG